MAASFLQSEGTKKRRDLARWKPQSQECHILFKRRKLLGPAHTQGDSIAQGLTLNVADLWKPSQRLPTTLTYCPYTVPVACTKGKSGFPQGRHRSAFSGETQISSALECPTALQPPLPPHTHKQIDPRMGTSQDTETKFCVFSPSLRFPLSLRIFI